jgi:hypothetical protein
LLKFLPTPQQTTDAVASTLAKQRQISYLDSAGSSADFCPIFQAQYMTLRRTTGPQPARNHQQSSIYPEEKPTQRFPSLNQRPALVTIQQNIRRNKSRLAFAPDVGEDEDDAHAGAKRKRNQVNNENANSGTSQPRSAKRFKPSASPSSSESETEEAMETGNDIDQDEELSTEFYLYQAPRSQLLKLKKDLLVMLYREADIPRSVPDAEQLTRSAIVSALISARSRPRRGASNRAPNGNAGRSRRPAGGAPFTPDSDDYNTHGRLLPARNLRRTATDTEATHKSRHLLGRSFSLNAANKGNRRDRYVLISSV